jgi:peptidoglycan/LPS O-acetylase OafA/YrhL
MLLMRSGIRIRVRHSFLVCTVLLVVSMALPRFGGSDHLWVNGVYESICIIVLFPIVVAIGAGHRDSPDLHQLCRSLGDLSYPLYTTHYPLIYLYTAWMLQSPHSLAQRVLWGIMLWCTAVLFAYACLKLYDQPVRGWLSKRFLHTASSETSPSIP